MGGSRSERPNLLPVPLIRPGRGAAASGKSSAAGSKGGGESSACCQRLMYKKERGGASCSPAGKLQAAGPDWARRALNKQRALQGCQSRRTAGPQRARAEGGSGHRREGGSGDVTAECPQRRTPDPLLGQWWSREGLALKDARDLLFSIGWGFLAQK